MTSFTIQTTIKSGVNINTSNFATIIDRGLALKKSVKDDLSNVGILNCQIHIDRNLHALKYDDYKQLWHVANQALSLSEKTNAINDIRKKNNKAAEYVNSIENGFLIDKHDQGFKLYGMKTSNLIEQLYAEYLPERNLSTIFHLVYSIIIKSMDKQEKEKNEAANCNSIICPAALSKVAARNDETIGKGWTVDCVNSENGLYHVKDRKSSFNSGVADSFIRYSVKTGECSCLRPFQDDLPCLHGQLVIRYLQSKVDERKIDKGWIVNCFDSENSVYHVEEKGKSFFTYLFRTGECSCLTSSKDNISCIHGQMVYRYLQPTFNNALNNQQLFKKDLFYGDIYFTTTWRKLFTGYCVHVPTLEEVDSFRILNHAKLEYPHLNCPLSFTSDRQTKKRIRSNGESLSVATVSYDYVKGKTKKQKCFTCGESFSTTTTHNSSACAKMVKKSPTYHTNLHANDIESQTNYDLMIAYHRFPLINEKKSKTFFSNSFGPVYYCQNCVGFTIML